MASKKHDALIILPSASGSSIVVTTVQIIIIIVASFGRRVEVIDKQGMHIFLIARVQYLRYPILKRSSTSRFVLLESLPRCQNCDK